jgi:signal peptide peptidase SppA
MKSEKKQTTSQVPTRLLNTPLMIARTEAEAILNVLQGTAIDISALYDEHTYVVQNGVAIIPIVGGLTYRGYGWYWRTTYSQICKDFRAALDDSDVSAIVFDIDSPGGEVAGCFDLVDEIYQTRGIKPVYAIANEACYSAAYAIASAADKVFLPRTGNIGSVGVIAIHYEQAKYEEEAGVKYTAIYAGAHKDDFSMHHALSDEAREVAQRSVDKSYDIFCQTVARNRGMSEEEIRETEAAIYKGDDAVSMGLADEVASWDQAMAGIVAGIDNQGGSIMRPEEVRIGLAAMLGDPEQRSAATDLLSGLGFQPADQAEDVEAQIAQAREEGHTEGHSKGIEEARSLAVEIASACEVGGMPKMAGQLIQEGISVEDAGKRILEAKGGESNRTVINSAVDPLNTGEKNPLIEDAKRRSEAA